MPLTPMISHKRKRGITNSKKIHWQNARTSRSHFNNTSGDSDPVWIHKVPYSAYHHAAFAPLKQSIKNTDVCIIGAGIAGISLAYELIARGGKQVTMIEARHVLSGETGRTSGHLSNALDDGYTNIEKKHGRKGAKVAAESHTWAHP